MSGPVLRMDDVGVALRRGGRVVPVVERFSAQIGAGEMLALVGESGSGKTVAAMSIPRLLPDGTIVRGQISLDGKDISCVPERDLMKVRGRRVGVVFQDPLAALNPVHRIGAQIAEAIWHHGIAPRSAARQRAIQLLDEVGIVDAERRAREYPHQFSGGMRQRACIAMALACEPSLLIADEPLTGLDADTAAQIMALLARLRDRHGMAVLLISHDLARVRQYADRVHVLYAGRTIEHGPAQSMLAAPRHPYTRALLAASPVEDQAPVGIDGAVPEPEARTKCCPFLDRCGVAGPACAVEAPPVSTDMTEATCFFPQHGTAEVPRGTPHRPTRTGAELLRAQRITVRYRTGLLARPGPPVLDGASFWLARGECLAVVGPSGSGKSTLGRAVLQMVPYDGDMWLEQEKLSGASRAALRAARRRIGVVFQDPGASLNPILTVAETLGEALELAGVWRGEARRARMGELMRLVGLPESLLDRLPATLSGGQAQRVAIGRALAGAPDVLVLDEPTSSLDVSTQALVLNLLHDLAAERELSYIVITHDLAAVSFLAHRVSVVRNGHVVTLR